MVKPTPWAIEMDGIPNLVAMNHSHSRDTAHPLRINPRAVTTTNMAEPFMTSSASFMRSFMSITIPPHSSKAHVTHFVMSRRNIVLHGGKGVDGLLVVVAQDGDGYEQLLQVGDAEPFGVLHPLLQVNVQFLDALVGADNVAEIQHPALSIGVADLEALVEAAGTVEDTRPQAFGVVGRRQKDQALNMVHTIKDVEDFRLVVHLQGGVDVLHQYHGGGLRLNLPEHPHPLGEKSRVAELDDNALALDHVLHNQLDGAGLATAGRTPQHDATLVGQFIFPEDFLLLPERLNLPDDPLAIGLGEAEQPLGLDREPLEEEADTLGMTYFVSAGHQLLGSMTRWNKTLTVVGGPLHQAGQFLLPGFFTIGMAFGWSDAVGGFQHLISHPGRTGNIAVLFQQFVEFLVIVGHDHIPPWPYFTRPHPVEQ